MFLLRFYGPVNPMRSCRARSVYQTTCLLGRLSPLSGYQYCAHSFARNLQLPFLNQRKGENDRRKYFMIKSPWKNVANLSGGWTPRPPGLQLDGTSNWATEAGSTCNKTLHVNGKFIVISDVVVILLGHLSRKCLWWAFGIYHDVPCTLGHASISLSICLSTIACIYTLEGTILIQSNATFSECLSAWNI